MKESHARERQLLGATIASGMVLLLSHTGGPMACSAEDVVVRDVPQTMPPGYSSELALRHLDHTEYISQGTLIEINGETQGALVGFNPTERRLMISPDGKVTNFVPAESIYSLAILGEHRAGPYAGNGALIGGLSGAALGFAVGAGSSYPELGPVCAVGFGVPSALLGTGIGALTGAAIGRPRKDYDIAAWAWQLGEPPRPQPARGAETPVPAERAPPSAPDPTHPAPADSAPAPADSAPAPAATVPTTGYEELP